jgi:tetratricopeptide (TPR) repeat protein
MSEGNLNTRVKKSYLARSRSLLEKAEDINPNIVEIYRLKGLTYLHLGEFSLAELAYKKMLTLNNESSAGWTDLGNVYLIQGNITGAGDAFSKALELDPSNDQALIGDINILFSQKRFDRAIDLARPLYIKTADRKIKIQLAEIIGKSYSKLTKYNEATEYFNEGLNLDPDSVSINYGLAELSFYSSFNIKEPVESTNDSKRRAMNVINLDQSYPYSYGLLTRIASVTKNETEYNKYLQLAKEKVNEYSFMNQGQKEVFLKTLPLFNKVNNSVKIRVTSVESTPGSTSNNVNTLISK